MLALILKLLKKYRAKLLKIAVFDDLTLILRPLSREPPRISLYRQKLESLGYIIVDDGVNISSFKLSRWAQYSVNASILKQCVMAVQGHPGLLILAPTERTYSKRVITLELTQHIRLRYNKRHGQTDGRLTVAIPR